MSAPRLKTKLWIDAVLRANAIEGRFGAVLHIGAEEAGAVYVVINRLNGTSEFLGPAPGASVDNEGTKQFERVIATPVPWLDLRDRIARLRKADPDIWVIEVEDREGFGGLTLAA
jgi:hypothetical protein